jgi:hypothetical protein
MKMLIVLAVTFAGFTASAEDKITLNCADETSQLNLATGGGFDPIEGEYRYNKSLEGEYGSLMVLGCKAMPLDEVWDYVDCTETTYGVIGPALQVPKGTFSTPSDDPFDVVYLSRDESDGSIYSTSRFTKCTATVSE